MAFEPMEEGSCCKRALVRLDRVSKKFGSTVALKDLSLEIRSGEFLTLLGPSGCGKTTTLRLINGFEVSDSGSVSINGLDVTHVPPFRRNVNTVFQNYALFPHLTVFENVAYALRVKRLATAEVKARVLAMLDRVGLSDKASRLPHELSGGQMQRVALGRALINEPTVLLLDEPLSALDTKLRRAMQLELRRMHAELGLTFVCVTHDQEEALVMSDRIAVLDAGEIAQIGTPQDIFERPRNRFVADFIGGCNFIPISIDQSKSFTLRNRKPHALARGREVLMAIRPQNLKIGVPEEGAAFDANVYVSDVVYLGTAVRLVLRLGSDVELTAEIDRRAIGTINLEPSTALHVWARRDDVIVFDGAGWRSNGDG
ncbi:ABC transporter ATP-binding protein [Mesorhizobium sp.]|uniref:ABC transporter ATP-binding protein n=1 Tax=Mesorhizobium sp. TaxID=1871066 RepID=UPI00120180E8|nr:ABC transporter ATP-binding protein [Mesorhizobium sp.]TIO26766.1 MAG: ABC transporter ATP-binding protein [Mesorhizobium sp.]